MPPHCVFLQCWCTSGFRMTSYITGICASTPWTKSHYLLKYTNRLYITPIYNFNSPSSSKSVSLSTKPNFFFLISLQFPLLAFHLVPLPQSSHKVSQLVVQEHCTPHPSLAFWSMSWSVVVSFTLHYLSGLHIQQLKIQIYVVLLELLLILQWLYYCISRPQPKKMALKVWPIKG